MSLARGHVPELDGLRGWACGSVLIAHTLTGIMGAPEGPLGELVKWWNTHTIWIFLHGVDLFFVLSGFLVGGILLDSKHKEYFFAHFWIRRAARILPVAYAVVLSYAIALMVTQALGVKRFDGWLLADPKPPIWSLLLFIQSWWFALGGANGPRWIAMSWSLAIEEQFYVFFPVLVFLLRRRAIVILALAGVLIAPVLRDVFYHVFGNWYAPYVLLPSRMDSLFWGVLAALILRHPPSLELARSMRGVLDLIAFLILWSIWVNWVFPYWSGPPSPHAPLRGTFVGVLGAILILRIFLHERSLLNAFWRNAWLAKLGLISYGLYMYHQAVNGVVHGLLFVQEPTIKSIPQLFAAFAVIIISIAISVVSYVYMEKPIRRWATKVSDKLRNRETPDAAQPIPANA